MSEDVARRLREIGEESLRKEAIGRAEGARYDLLGRAALARLGRALRPDRYRYLSDEAIIAELLPIAETEPEPEKPEPEKPARWAFRCEMEFPATDEDDAWHMVAEYLNCAAHKDGRGLALPIVVRRIAMEEIGR